MAVSLNSIIESIVLELSPLPVYAYGTANEINDLGDKVTTGTPVVFLVDAYKTGLDFAMSGGFNRSYSFLMQFMEQTPQGQYLTENDPVLVRQSGYCENFLIKLRDYSLNGIKVFKIEPNKTKVDIISKVAKYDANYTGVTLDVRNLSIIPNQGFC